MLTRMRESRIERRNRAIERVWSEAETRDASRRRSHLAAVSRREEAATAVCSIDVRVCVPMSIPTRQIAFASLFFRSLATRSHCPRPPRHSASLLRDAPLASHLVSIVLALWSSPLLSIS